MKVKELIDLLKDKNPNAVVYIVEAKTELYQKVETCEQDFSNLVSLGCREIEDDEKVED